MLKKLNWVGFLLKLRQRSQMLTGWRDARRLSQLPSPWNRTLWKQTVSIQYIELLHVFHSKALPRMYSKSDTTWQSNLMPWICSVYVFMYERVKHFCHRHHCAFLLYIQLQSSACWLRYLCLVILVLQDILEKSVTALSGMRQQTIFPASSSGIWSFNPRFPLVISNWSCFLYSSVAITFYF